MMLTKSSPVPPLVTTMTTTSFLATAYHTDNSESPVRESTVTMSTEGDFADVVDSAERDRRIARRSSIVTFSPTTYTELPNCTLPMNIELPRSPVEGGSTQVPKVRLHFVRHAQVRKAFHTRSADQE